jgi:iron complex outermembrane recepter protein
MPSLTVRGALRAVISLPVLWAPLIITAVTVAVPAAAQETPAENAPLQEVVVTGIRHGIEDAIKVKENSGSIVEAISAEDIGKLPDTSIAESIARLPGLTSQRAEGRASAISLRGTDPGFTTTLLNGREQVSTGDNRSIEFDQYPSELLSAVVIYKTPDARLIGQGLAGTIELRTTRPLEYGRRALAFNVRGERNSNSSLGADSTDKGYRASISYIDQYADNKVGLTFGLARLNSPLTTEGYGTYEPWSANGAGIFTTAGMKVRTDMGENTRDGAMAALEFRPVDSFTSILDLYYTKSHEKDNARSIEVNVSGYPAPCCDPSPTGFAGAGITQFGITNATLRENSTVAGTLSTVLPLVRNFQFITDDKIFATGLNNKWSSGRWTVVGDVSYSRATRDQFQPENNAEYLPDQRPSCPTTTPNPSCHPIVTVTNPDGSTKTVDAPRNNYDTGQYALAGSSMPSLTFQKDYTDSTQVQLGPTIYGTGYVKKPHVKDELKSGRLDAALDLTGWFDQVAFGVNYADRTKDKTSPESSLSTIAGGFTTIGSQYLFGPTNLGYAGAPLALAWDVPAVMAAYYKPIVYGDPTTLTYLIGKWWTVKEKLTTSYIRADLNHPLTSSVTLKGNVGLQVVNTDQSSNSFFHDSVSNAVVPFTDGKKYADVLPEINLVFALPEQQALRLGLAKEVARPRMDQLKASSEDGVGFNNGAVTPSGSAGNPRLDPWRADAADLSYEKYFSTRAYVSAAAFYKKLKSYIFNQTDPNHDFTAFMATVPPGVSCPPPPAPCPRTNFGPLSGPVNGQGGNLKGVELTASLPGDMLSNELRHFGTILSLSQTDSNITVQDANGNNVLSGNNLGRIPLPGLSKTVWSATFYYENEGFSARIATRYRSKYIGEVVNFANDRAFKFVKADEITDFQTGYEFGSVKGLSLLFQINNMFNSPYIAYQRFESQEIDYQLYGRQFLLGVNYRIE